MGKIPLSSLRRYKEGSIKKEWIKRHANGPLQSWWIIPLILMSRKAAFIGLLSCWIKLCNTNLFPSCSLECEQWHWYPYPPNRDILAQRWCSVIHCVFLLGYRILPHSFQWNWLFFKRWKCNFLVLSFFSASTLSTLAISFTIGTHFATWQLPPAPHVPRPPLCLYHGVSVGAHFTITREHQSLNYTHPDPSSLGGA